MNTDGTGSGSRFGGLSLGDKNKTCTIICEHVPVLAHFLFFGAQYQNPYSYIPVNTEVLNSKCPKHLRINVGG